MKFKFICFLAVHFLALSSVVAQTTPIPVPGSTYLITPVFANSGPDDPVLKFGESVIDGASEVIGLDANGAEVISSDSAVDLGGGVYRFELSLETTGDPMDGAGLTGINIEGNPVDLIPHTGQFAFLSTFDGNGDLVDQLPIDVVLNLFTPDWDGDLNLTFGGGPAPFYSQLTLAFTVEVDSFLLGDINRDGVISLLDVQPFVDLIPNSAPFQGEGDINGDGLINLLDVGGFVDLLTQGG